MRYDGSICALLTEFRPEGPRTFFAHIPSDNLQATTLIDIKRQIKKEDADRDRAIHAANHRSDPILEDHDFDIFGVDDSY